jgi:hypothetical protein
MIDGDRHWASDVVAGALIGHAIGYSIGKAFRRRAQGAHTTEGAQLMPVLRPGQLGVAISCTW